MKKRLENEFRYSGVLNVYKEKGMTSHDVIWHLRKIIQVQKIGHTGTLDPNAEGVLPVCIGSAAKLCSMLTDHDKEYRAGLRLGIETDTQDLTGRILREQEVLCSEEEFREAVKSFEGGYEQMPPMYSAVKIEGKRLYEMARKGVEVERTSRFVQIPEISVESVLLPDAVIRVSCSRGTYIRTLCSDIGEKLHCCATMSSLLRLRVGSFRLEDAKTLDEIRKACENHTFETLLRTPDTFFPDAPKARIREDLENGLYNGNRFTSDCFILTDPGSQRKKPEFVRLYDTRDRFVGLYKRRGRSYLPDMMFWSQAQPH